MFDDDDRRLVQVASIANAIGTAENTSPWRALEWLASETVAGTLAARLFIPVRMNTVGTTCASPEESLRAWKDMARRTQDAFIDGKLKMRLPSSASTWHVHVNDLLRFIEVGSMAEAVRAELRELAQRYRGALGSTTPPSSQANLAMVSSGAGAATAPAKGEAVPVAAPVKDEPMRRLAALRELGGSVRWFKGKWEIKGINALTAQEIGRPRSSQKTIRIDLLEAAESEKREGKSAAWHP